MFWLRRLKIGLTDKKIKTWRPRRYSISDGRALFLELTPKASMTWIFRYRLNGNQAKVTTGPYPEPSLKDARTKRDDLAGDIAKGNSPADEKRRAKQVREIHVTTLKEFGDRYYREQIEKNWKNSPNQRRNLDKYLYPALGDGPLSEITPSISS